MASILRSLKVQPGAAATVMFAATVIAAGALSYDAMGKTPIKGIGIAPPGPASPSNSQIRGTRVPGEDPSTASLADVAEFTLSPGKGWQLPVLPFNRFVAFAGAFAQTFDIKYFYFAAGVLDHPGFNRLG